jgi:hypothetical protein
MAVPPTEQMISGCSLWPSVFRRLRVSVYDEASKLSAYPVNWKCCLA